MNRREFFRAAAGIAAAASAALTFASLDHRAKAQSLQVEWGTFGQRLELAFQWDPDTRELTLGNRGAQAREIQGILFTGGQEHSQIWVFDGDGAPVKELPHMRAMEKWLFPHSARST